MLNCIKLDDEVVGLAIVLLFSQNDFATIVAMPEKLVYLGELHPLYNQYREIVDSVADEEVQVQYRDDIAADNVSKIKGHEIMAHLSQENYGQLLSEIEKARYTTTTARKVALVKNGFAGTIVHLFEQIDELTLEADASKRQELQDLITQFICIKPDHQKGALLLGSVSSAYYFGGHLIKLSQEVVESKN